MASKLFAHVRRQWMGALALFLVLSGGTAWAVNEWTGANIVDGSLATADYKNNDIRSVDVRNDSFAGGGLQSSDLAAGAVGQADLAPAEAWHELGAAGEPALNTTNGNFCSWTNFDSNHDSAAFYRDPFGQVPLKGLVQVDTLGDPGDCWYANGVGDGSYQIGNRRIFTLPQGYRPAKRLADIALSNGTVARIDVDGPGLSGQPAGAVSVDYPTDSADVSSYLSLNGISFRCAPSGQNGCP
jgi:hypothetical protein